MDIRTSHRNQEGTTRSVFVSLRSVHLDSDSDSRADADQVVVVVLVGIRFPNHRPLVDIHILTMVQ